MTKYKVKRVYLRDEPHYILLKKPKFFSFWHWILWPYKTTNHMGNEMIILKTHLRFYPEAEKTLKEVIEDDQKRT